MLTPFAKPHIWSSD